jgi:two-component SAPR family response regulator
MNGIDFVKVVKQEIPGVKVLFMSGYSYLADELPHESFIAKPFLSMADLARKIREILDA